MWGHQQRQVLYLPMHGGVYPLRPTIVTIIDKGCFDRARSPFASMYKTNGDVSKQNLVFTIAQVQRKVLNLPDIYDKHLCVYVEQLFIKTWFILPENTQTNHRGLPKVYFDW